MRTGISGVRSDSLSTVPQPLPRLRASLSGLNSVPVALHSIRQPFIFFLTWLLWMLLVGLLLLLMLLSLLLQSFHPHNLWLVKLRSGCYGCCCFLRWICWCCRCYYWWCGSWYCCCCCRCPVAAVIILVSTAFFIAVIILAIIVVELHKLSG